MNKVCHVIEVTLV